jgi:hypothetical protein
VGDVVVPDKATTPLLMLKSPAAWGRRTNLRGFVEPPEPENVAAHCSRAGKRSTRIYIIGGGLISYRADMADLFRGAASYYGDGTRSMLGICALWRKTAHPDQLRAPPRLVISRGDHDTACQIMEWPAERT